MPERELVTIMGADLRAARDGVREGWHWDGEILRIQATRGVHVLRHLRKHTDGRDAHVFELVAIEAPPAAYRLVGTHPWSRLEQVR